MQTSELIKLFTKFKPDDIVYPGLLKRTLDINLECSYLILKDIECLDVIHKVFIVKCSSCGHLHNDLFNSFNEATTSIEYCYKCGEEINSLDSIELIFRVNKDA